MVLLRWMKSAAVLAAMGTCAYGQQVTAAKVEFRNPGPFGQKELETVAGVHPGQKLALKEMQAAAQRLADTGCFEDVHLDSKGSPDALTLIFILKPSVSGDLHRAAFANFVWFTEAELEGIVQKSAPLFAGELPETEGVLDSVSAGLQQALVAKGMPDAEVSHKLILATSERPVTTVSFRVERPRILLSTLTVEGILPQFATAVNTAERLLRGKVYLGEGADISTAELLLRPYLDAGYLDARLADEKLTEGPPHDGVVDVSLTTRIEGGEPYHVASIQYDGTAVAPAAAFVAGAKLHAGDVASEKALDASLATIDKAYRKLGYMDAYVDPAPKKDTAAHTVSYALKVVPGVAYHVRSVDVQGLSAEAKQQFDQVWAMRPGAPYDPDYVSGFLGNNTAVRGLAKYSGGFQAVADPSTQQVDLVVKFAPMGQ